MQSTSWSVRILSLLALLLCLLLLSVDSTSAAPKKPKAHASVRKRRVTKPTESKSGPVASSPKTSKASGRRDILSRNEIRDVEQKLYDLGYWTGPIDGKPDEASRHALIAFQNLKTLRFRAQSVSHLISRGEHHLIGATFWRRAWEANSCHSCKFVSSTWNWLPPGAFLRPSPSSLHSIDVSP